MAYSYQIFAPQRQVRVTEYDLGRSHHLANSSRSMTTTLISNHNRISLRDLRNKFPPYSHTLPGPWRFALDSHNSVCPILKNIFKQNAVINRRIKISWDGFGRPALCTSSFCHGLIQQFVRHMCHEQGSHFQWERQSTFSQGLLDIT